jgi:hypothetical protein
MPKAYKLLVRPGGHGNNEHFRSLLCHNLAVDYILEQPIRPKISNSYLFVFKSLNYAVRDFRAKSDKKRYSIWEVECSELIVPTEKIPNILALWNAWGVVEFWETKSAEKYLPLTPPDGTLWTPELTMSREVTEEEMKTV